MASAAVLAGGAAHFVPISRRAALGANSAGSSGSSGSGAAHMPPGRHSWQSCAWHPREPVCALLAPDRLSILLAPSGGSGNVAGAGICAPSLVASVACPGTGSAGGSPDCGAAAAVAATSRCCCLAWLPTDAPETLPACAAVPAADSTTAQAATATGSSLSTWHAQLAVNWGSHLELLTFGSGEPPDCSCPA